MQLKLAHKLFLAFVLTTAAVVVIMLATQRYAFQRGFLAYVDQVETSRLEYLANALERRYAEEGSWDFVAGRERWPREMLANVFFGGVDESARDSMERMRFMREILGAPEPPSGMGFPNGRHRPVRPGERAGLYDLNDQWIAGTRVESEGPIRIELKVGENAIGQLLIEPVRSVTNALDVQFARQQRRALFPASIGLFVVAALAAALVTASLMRPIRSLERGATELTAGRYQSRIKLKRKDELGRLAESFNALAETLENNRDARQQWGADISHELRTPLAVLKSELEALEDGVRPVNRQAIASLSAEVDRLGTLVSDLYELSRSDIGAMSYAKQRVDIGALLNDVARSLESRLESNGLTLEIESAATSPVSADPDRLRQLFGNLLENAVRYTDAGGRVRIATETVGNAVRVTVEDSAPGVPEDSLNKLFDRLYRVDPSRSRETGAAGLGLAICARIVEAHGGTIRARHSSLGGVAIDVDLPALI